MTAVIRLPTGDPFATLEPPVVRVGQHHLHEHVVMRRQAETCNVKAEKGEHSPANRNIEKKYIEDIFETRSCNESFNFLDLKMTFFFFKLINFFRKNPAVSPALLGDDHLGLVPVKLLPQWPVAEVDLGPGSRPGAG